MALFEIPIVLACDDNYAAHLSVVIQSTLENGSASHFYRFFVLDGGITPDNKRKLHQVEAQFGNAKISFLDVTSHFLHIVLTCLPLATFFRLVLPDILKDVEKIVYLDTDVVVLKDVAELYAEDVSDSYIAAAEDEEICLLIARKSSIHLDRTPHKDKDWNWYAANVVGLDPTNPAYFNAGVAVYNLELMRRDHITERLMSFLEQNQPLALCDQDVLNAVLKDKKRLISPLWNVKPSPTLKAGKGNRHPFIVHYRLWAYGVRHSDRYWYYLAKTPFAGTVNRKPLSYRPLFVTFIFMVKVRRKLANILEQLYRKIKLI